MTINALDITMRVGATGILTPLLINAVLVAGSGNYALAGTDANLFPIPIQDIQISAEVGNYLFTGFSIGGCPTVGPPIFEHDFNFDGGTLGNRVTEFSDNLLMTYSNTESFAGGQSAECEILNGTSGFGFWGGIKQFSPHLVEGDEIYIRIRLFQPSTFDNGAVPFLKFLRLKIETVLGVHKGFVDLYLRNDDGSGKGIYRHQNELNTTAFSFQNFGAGNEWRLDEWLSYVYYIKFGSSDSVIRLWKHTGGTLVNKKRVGGEYTLIFDEARDLTMDDTDDEVVAHYLFTYWNGSSPQTQVVYIDDILISTNPPPEVCNII